MITGDGGRRPAPAAPVLSNAGKRGAELCAVGGVPAADQRLPGCERKCRSEEALRGGVTRTDGCQRGLSFSVGQSSLVTYRQCLAAGFTATRFVEPGVGPIFTVRLGLAVALPVPARPPQAGAGVLGYHGTVAWLGHDNWLPVAGAGPLKGLARTAMGCDAWHLSNQLMHNPVHKF